MDAILHHVHEALGEPPVKKWASSDACVAQTGVTCVQVEFGGNEASDTYSSYGFEELALLVKSKGGQGGNNRILPSEGGYKRGWGVVVCTTNRCRWRECVVATLTG
ncbi:hypothetical protein N7445_010062 [Penicillium cf. griseofulvum]|nr:hypothetical protein N7445_010062 [Penicillium cf. griseofulvum]